MSTSVWRRRGASDVRSFASAVALAVVALASGAWTGASAQTAAPVLSRLQRFDFRRSTGCGIRVRIC